MALWLVMIIEPCDNCSWLHGAYDDEEIARRGFGNALVTIFGPDWSTWLEVDERPDEKPVPVRRVVEWNYGLVELVGPIAVQDGPTPAEPQGPDWYRGLAMRGKPEPVQETRR